MNLKGTYLKHSTSLNKFMNYFVKGIIIPLSVVVKKIFCLRECNHKEKICKKIGQNVNYTYHGIKQKYRGKYKIPLFHFFFPFFLRETKGKNPCTDFPSVGRDSSLIHVVAVVVLVPNAAISVAFCLCCDSSSLASLYFCCNSWFQWQLSVSMILCVLLLAFVFKSHAI